MATGTRPFSRETVAETMTAILREDPPELSVTGRTVSPALDEVIRHCLEKRPEERFQSARDLAFALRALSGAQTTSGGAAVAPTVGRAQGRRPALAAVAAAAVIAGSGLGWAITSSRETPSESWATFTQLTDEAGEETTPVVAPDGGSIAYASRVAGSWDIYVRRIGGRNATIVAGDPDRDESAPAFSPDGRTVAFHESDADGGIFIVGATGESVRRVTAAGFHPAWSPDGRSLAFCDERIINPASRTVRSALSIVDVATGEIRRVTDGDAVQPAWSPSGTRLAYWGQTQGQRDLFTIAASGGDPVKVTDDIALDWTVVWSPDGRYLYFASDRGGAMNLWRVPIDEGSGRSTGRPEPVTTGVQTSSAMPSFSADGQRLVFQAGLASVNPAKIPFDPVTEQAGVPEYLFQRTGVLVPSSVSADGQWVAYWSSGQTVEDIYVSRIDGTGLRRLTDDVFRDRAPVWSPDGKSLAFYSNRSGAYEIWRIRIDGSGLTRLSDRPTNSLWYPFFEPSGRRLWAYDSQRRGPLTLAFDSGDEVAVQAGEDLPLMLVEGGMLRPHGMSSDGSRLAGVALSPAGTRFGVGWHDLRTGKTVVSTQDANPGMTAWLPDGRRFVFAVGEHTLALIDTNTGRRRVLGPFPFEIQTAPPAVSSDGRSIIVGALKIEADVWMVERIGKQEK
jgi:Tol biopolymer transport system component